MRRRYGGFAARRDGARAVPAGSASVSRPPSSLYPARATGLRCRAGPVAQTSSHGVDIRGRRADGHGGTR